MKYPKKIVLLQWAQEKGFISKGALDSSPNTVEYVPALQRMQVEEFVVPVIFERQTEIRNPHIIVQLAGQEDQTANP